MNYLGDGSVTSNLIDCRIASDANNVIDQLINRGYTSGEIDAITHQNAKRVINHILTD